MPRGHRNGATPTIDSLPKPPPEQMSLNLDEGTAGKFLAEISALKQKMDDIRAELANKYKAFEEAGGDRKMLKVVIRFQNQDVSKTISEKRALDQYFEWFVRPEIDKSSDDGTEH
jgi:uncharacterized protein (UPF0335 family)